MKIYKIDTSRWHIVRILFLVASLLVTASLALFFATGQELWLLLAAFVSLMQFASSLFGYCPLAILLDKMGIPRS